MVLPTIKRGLTQENQLSYQRVGSGDREGTGGHELRKHKTFCFINCGKKEQAPGEISWGKSCQVSILNARHSELSTKMKLVLHQSYLKFESEALYIPMNLYHHQHILLKQYLL